MKMEIVMEMMEVMEMSSRRTDGLSWWPNCGQFGCAFWALPFVHGWMSQSRSESFEFVAGWQPFLSMNPLCPLP